MNNKEKTIKLILQDLYRIDGALREHEEELIEVITQLIKARPQAELDENFRMELREQILKMARDIKLNTKFGKSKFTWADAFMGQFLKPAGLVVAGVLLAAVVAVPIILSRGGGVEDLKSQFAFKVTQTSDEAFGSLAPEQQAPLEAGPLTGQVAPAEGEALGKGVGGPVGAVREGVSLEAAPSAMPIQRINYNYVYTGDDFTIDQGKMPVFQKIKSESTASALGSYLGGMDLGVLDLSKFTNTKVENFTIVEDKANGYMVSVQLSEGTVSINKNWTQWQRGPQEPLKTSDLPQDSAMVALTDKFVRDYGIDLANYGKGEVSKEWMRSYGIPEMAGELYVPSNISVVYPLIVDGKKVYERNGYESGLQVSVDIREMKVSSLWNLSSQSYKSSLYETETDVDKILEAAQSGQRKYYFDNPTKTLEFELGTPEQILVRIYSHDNGEAKQFLAPALLFPVTKMPEAAGYYQESIVVPLVKELLEKESAQVYPVPMGVRTITPAPDTAPTSVKDDIPVSSPAIPIAPPQE